MNIEHLRVLIEQQGGQKEVAGRIVDWFDAKGLPNQNLTTLTSRVCNLLAGNHPQAWRSFSEEPYPEALADATKVPLAEILAMLRRVPILLDPALPAHAVAALQRQAEGSDHVELLPAVGIPRRADTNAPAFGRVNVSSSSDERLLLRDAARAQPRALIVLASDADLGFYTQDRRRVSFLTRVPRGYELDDEPSLVPVPRPKPGSQWVHGSPHVVHPELTAWMRRNRAEEAIVRKADDADEEPSFPLASALLWFKSKGLVVELAERAHSSKKHEFAFPEKSKDSTYVWGWERRMFATGPEANAFAALLPGHEVVVDPPEIAAWSDAVSRRNPFDADAFSDLGGQMSAIGLNLDGWLSARRASFESGEYKESNKTLNLPAFGDDGEQRARDALVRLAKRPMEGVPTRWMALPLYFSLASEAPLSPLPLAESDVFHVLASLGAGRVLRIRVAQFEGAASGTLRRDTRSTSDYKSVSLDGDGTHVVVQSLYDENLEGGLARPRQRRAKD